jgi:GT2 family glycosyltransferase
MAYRLVGIVILNWNRPIDTIMCLKSLEYITYRDYFIVVIDNGSTDNSLEQIRAAAPHATVLPLSQNLGFASGVNIGIDRAIHMGAEYVLLLNNDTVVAPNFLEPLVEAMDEDPKIGISVPKIYFFAPPWFIYAAGAKWTNIPPRVKMIGYGKPDNPLYNKSRDLDYATGCALLIRCQLFKSVGTFDPIYFMYQEDYDFCHRVRKAGYRIVYVPQSRVWHKGSQGLGENSYMKWYLWAKSTVIFYRKNFSLLSLMCFLGWVGLREMIRGNTSFLKPFIDGICDGFRTPIRG